MTSIISKNTVVVKKMVRNELDFDFSALDFGDKEWLSLFKECKEGDEIYVGVTVIRKNERERDAQDS